MRTDLDNGPVRGGADSTPCPLFPRIVSTFIGFPPQWEAPPTIISSDVGQIMYANSHNEVSDATCVRVSHICGLLARDL